MIRTRKRGHEISGGLKSGLRRKGNALNLNADDNISGESLDESLGNPWGNPGESLDESLDESLGNP